MIDRYTGRLVPRFLPFQEPVTYYSRTGPDGYTPYFVFRARRKKLRKERLPDLLQRAEVVWQVASDQLPAVPMKDDYLTDEAGASWVVVEVVGQLNGQVYNLLCREKV